MPRMRLRKPSKETPSSDTKPLVEISEDEQWRLINESGVLNKVSDQSPSNTTAHAEDPSPYPLVDEILDTSMWIMPFCSILLIMEVLIHTQYGRHATSKELVDRLCSGGPILALFIFFIHRHKRNRNVQIFLFLLSCVVGTRLVYLIARGSWLVNMRQCPPLATIWIYATVELNLGSAVASLLVTGSFVWWKGLQKYLF
ncbi:hypothetical protein BDP27DRAFT_1314738 [Rhodocollybia butyracea]|uniref:DUF7719 domain-containing protein n=1 Tax=Rhodocollybia butyracea TaxID=206335 RepID=A0A9P5Q825_9AGAR|nr:hypothetical protein BDP27DRAFT_1314738 [Rhodocollybia butyracea]